MRLLARTTVYYLLISLPLLFLAGLASYYLIREEVRDGMDESLERERKNAIYLIEQIRPASVFYLSLDSLSNIQPLPSSHEDDCELRDQKLFDRNEQEKNHYRVLSCYYTSGNKTYLITLATPAFEEDELVEGLESSLLLVIGFLILSFFIVNWLLLKNLWRPFNKALQALEKYSLTDNPELKLEKTTIKEFRQLNAALIETTGKAYRDYAQQKEFTENASHELQTPLAVMRAAIDNLLQSQNLKEDEFNQLLSLEKSINKLSLLNTALLLLTKIENHQFKEIQELNLNELVTKISEDYEAFYESKKITVSKLFHTNKSIQINPQLAELLIGNLIKNAFKHNHHEGNIIIEVRENTLSISNTGSALTIHKDEIFNRFRKNNASDDSLGLGLAIVKSIIDNYGYSITYDYKNDLHSFIINFNAGFERDFSGTDFL